MVAAILSTLKVYWLPLILLLASLFCQLILIPSSYPSSHYDVLGIEMNSSIEEVIAAYEKLVSKWKSGLEAPSSSFFIQIQYSFELLSNPLWKRNYDIFNIDEQIGVIDSAKKQYAGKKYWEIKVPLLDVTSFDNTFHILTSVNYQHVLEYDKPLLIKIYSHGSRSCAEFFDSWKSIAALLDGVANIAMVELSDVQLATYLAQKRSTRQPFFSNGIPSLVAFPQDCKAFHCLVRYDGRLSVDAITDWFASKILNLPRILYYSKETLGPNFLAKSRSYKVKVIFFSRTGERATPFVRQTAIKYWAHASFAFVLWHEEESIIWWNAFELNSAPAIVILKDPGVKPFVYHGSVNRSKLLNILDENKQQVLPQLRSMTSMDLGCHPRGYSRAGSDTVIWYCVILAGRQSPELNTMRKTMHRVQEILSTYGGKLEIADNDQTKEPSAIALKQKRLTLAWLDGEVQKDYCNFYLDAPYNNDACGPRRYPTDDPKLFIVRYKRNDSEETLKVEKRPQPIIEFFQKDVDHASQLVAIYNGSSKEPQQIIQWISKIIRDGDSSNLPFYRTRTPSLVPDDADPPRSSGTRGFVIGSMNPVERIMGFLSRAYIFLGPIFLLAALMSFSTIWLRSNLGVPIQSNFATQLGIEDDGQRRRQSLSTPNPDFFSITDVEPKNSYQMPFTDSDSE